MHMWWLLSKRIPKHKLFIIGAILEIFVLIPFIFYESEWVIPWIYFLFISRGFTVSVGYLLPPSLVPDVIEIYKKIYQQRQEATFYSMLMFVEKVAIAFAFGTSSWALGSAGYYNPNQQSQHDPSDPQNEQTIWTLRILVGVAPMIFISISISLSVLYDILYKRKYRNVLSDSDTDWD